jgi:phosphoserine phosphatase
MPRAPLGYTPGDRVGLALDLDGTAYRDGSVFVETMAYLAVGGSTLDLDAAERERLRRTVLEVARYRGGEPTRRRWAWVLRALGLVGTFGGPSLAGDAFERIARVRAGRSRPDSGASSASTSATRGSLDYDGMRRTTLRGYGEVLRGRDRTSVERATDRIVRERLPVDGRLRTVLGRVREAGGEVAFVSDAPAHLVRSYAALLVDDARIRATAFGTEEGRYTGRYEPVDKRAALETLRGTRDWDYVLAAGDSAVDAEMADVADCFLAVAGQGDGHRRFEASNPAPLAAPASLRRALGPDRRTVRVGPSEDLADALVAVLGAAGVL